MTLNDFNEWLENSGEIIAKTAEGVKSGNISEESARTIMLTSIASSLLVVARLIVDHRLELDEEEEYEPNMEDTDED